MSRYTNATVVSTVIEQRCEMALYFPEPKAYLKHLESEGRLWDDLHNRPELANELLNSTLGEACAAGAIILGLAVDILDYADADLLDIFANESEAGSGYID